MVRNEETLEASTYAERLPDDLSGRQCYVLDPMLATGGTLAAAIQFLIERGADHITAICLLAAPEGCARLERDLAGLDVPVTVVTAAMDERLNEKGYIVPGLGDAGRPALRRRRRSAVTLLRGGRPTWVLEALDRREQLAHGVLRVAEEQRGLRLEEQLVLDAGEAGRIDRFMKMTCLASSALRIGMP